MKEKNSKYLFLVSLASTLGGFLFGYDTAIISGCNQFLQEHYDLSASGLGWLVSSALVGTILGCIIAGMLTDSIGRKKCLILSAICLLISGIGSMLPPQFIGDISNPYWLTTSIDTSFYTLILFRIIGGVGVGITSVVTPIFISEIALPQNRGRMVSLYQLSITLGILFAFLIDWILLLSAGQEAGIVSTQKNDLASWLFKEEIWRGMFGTEIPIALCFLTLLFFVPKTPRWLFTKGFKNEALNVLIKLHGVEKAQLEITEIAKVPVQENVGLKELSKPFLRIPLLIGVLLPMFSHLSGIAAIMYFAPNIINESVQNVENAFLGAVLVGIVNSAFTFVAILNIEKFGRRKLLLVGVIGAFVSLTFVGVLFAVDSPYVIIPLLLYVASFAFSYGPIVWVIISEIFPTRIRGIAVGLGSFTLMSTGFVITFTNPVLIEEIGVSSTFFIYAALTAPAIWFIWKFVPETKGKSLEEIEKLWSSEKLKRNFQSKKDSSD